MTNGGTNRRGIHHAAVKLGIGTIVLLLLQGVANNLAALNQPVPLGWTHVTYVAIARGAIQTAIFVLLVRFGLELRAVIESVIPSVPSSGQMVKFAVWIVPVALAYPAYSELWEALFGSSVMWLYQLLFALIGGGLLAMIAALAVRNLDALTDLVVHRLPHELPRWRPYVNCAACGTALPRNGSYCASCGKSPNESSDASTATVRSSCPKCHALIGAPDQRFCRSCGAALQVA